MNTWLNEIISALNNLGGSASYTDLYDYIENHTTRKMPKSWKAIIRGTIERHSSDSKAFEGKKDIFYSVGGIGSGIWALRK